MRGCLFVLLVAAALLGGIAWFGSPPLAQALVGVVLQGSGWRAADTVITASADPPPTLLLGRADRLTIAGSDVDWRNLHAARVVLTLDGVDLFGRSARQVHGTIDDATLVAGSESPTPHASIVLAGPSAGTAATITIDGASLGAAIRDQVSRQLGITITDVKLTEPDRLTLTAGRTSVDGRLVIAPDGSLGFSTPLGTVTVLRVDPSIPLQLRSVAVVDGGLRVDGVLNVRSLLGG